MKFLRELQKVFEEAPICYQTGFPTRMLICMDCCKDCVLDELCWSCFCKDKIHKMKGKAEYFSETDMKWLVGVFCEETHSKAEKIKQNIVLG